MKERVLIIVAHPDDETIGMGGTIPKHVESGDEVWAISMTDGVSSREATTDTDICERAKFADNAASILGFEWVKRFQFCDNSMDKYPLLEIVQAIEQVKDSLNPTIVYTHSKADLNIDHRIVANAVLTAFRPRQKESCKEIRCFEVASSTDYSHPHLTHAFTPNLYVDINSFWAKKKEALSSYKDEMWDYPDSRSETGIENIAKYRGNQVGFYRAEAFEVIRKIVQ